ADHALIWLNMFRLLMVSIVPFSAALLGQHASDQLAVIFYGANLIALGLLNWATWAHGTAEYRLTEESMNPRMVGFVTKLALLPVAAYMLAILLSFINPLLSIIVYAIVPIPYILGISFR